MIAKRFFHICAGILCLALAYHLGAVTATAQAPANSVAASLPACANSQAAIVAANGDVYTTPAMEPCYASWTHVGNVFSGPTPAAQPAWGQLKSRYRPGAAATPQDK